LEHYQKALQIREEAGDLYGIAYSKYNIGFIYTKEHNNLAAEPYMLQCLELAKDNELKEVSMNALKLLYEIKKVQNNAVAPSNTTKNMCTER